MKEVEFMVLRSANQSFPFNSQCFQDSVRTSPNKNMDIHFLLQNHRLSIYSTGKKKKILTSTSVHSTNIQLDLEKKWTWLNYVSEN